MVFQKPNPFPKSIYDNVAAGLWVRGIRKKSVVDDRVEEVLSRPRCGTRSKIGCEHRPMASRAASNSGCASRARLLPNPEMLLLDEPTSALDPIATARIEELILELAPMVTIVIVTHNMQQAARISNYTAFMHLGRMVEFDKTTSNVYHAQGTPHAGLHHRAVWLAVGFSSLVQKQP